MRISNHFWLVAALVLAGTLMAYAAWGGSGSGRIVFPHAIHMEYEMACTDCHEGAEEEARASLPTAEVCYDCHDEELDPEWDSPELIAFFKERATGDGDLLFWDSYTVEDLKFSHLAHRKRGAVCTDCHGDVVEGKTIQGGNPDFKHTCLDCHKLMKAEIACSICHDTYRSDQQPPSHKESSFIGEHGRQVNHNYKKLPEGKCFFCHTAGQCDQCHKENKPAWHLKPLFQEQHGLQVRRRHLTLADSGCAFCHDKSGCQACHLQTQPRSHNITFKNRSHGMMARLDRDKCKVCHQQSFCVQCHTTKEPLSHRGQFKRGQQLHCFSCHLPLSDNTCNVCHRDLSGHASLPQPADAAHAAATPDTCRVCHSPPPHADNGLDCTFCHM